jgi:hypothetical protein
MCGHGSVEKQEKSMRMIGHLATLQLRMSEKNQTGSPMTYRVSGRKTATEREKNVT